ncbi:similar to Saccharomyces cerevisiae YMR293C HER2 Subunit of the trimeric GatFAB AmidoTransferase(AdT) complex [Maudiozyma saulgeensis]|uniref:Glutamyl-tRNA(Gln) amidotransferase subunit A, mitochondrial n=1 Tax=Maudiozyma saulgeensis TaxID=1789683 RepID=A0A1X7R5A6_9SACH|nr:similar to Saccharomyces cerevisiae YMR293C HER2 Subunit of the trimeric GatFAB AmidoTransferase(AdT) complex [Kazachstania saulgeensis]
MSLKSIITKIPTVQKEFNIFTSYIENSTECPADSSPASGKIGAIKDNIATKDFPTTCASDILKTYSSPFDATVVSLLKGSGAVIIGKTNLDEFGMGSLGLHTTFGPVRNPLNKDWCVGGSSSGSAAAVSCGIADFALGTDTGGSVRLPSAYSAIYGFKPSYGRISRWGVIAFAQSLDTVGIFANNIDTISGIFRILDQHDPRDPTSLSVETRESIKDQSVKFKDRSKLKIGIPKEFVQSDLAPEIKESFMLYIETLLEKDYEIYPISLPSIKDSLSVYYTLAPAEAASNLSRYDGIRYGKRNSTKPDIVNANFFTESRSYFGQEVKNRIILGNYNLCSDGYKNNFIKAQQLRVQMINQFDKIFRFKNILTNNKPDHDIDILLCPTNLSPPPPINSITHAPKSNPLHEYMNDIFTIPMSLAGLPAISVPFSKGKPYGIQITTQYGNDEALLKFVKETVL